jgi:intracellular septation protein
MKILLELFPLVLFFGTFKVYDIYVGTAVLMAATAVQMSLIYAIDRKLQVMHKFTLVAIAVFGTLTLVLHDERFIKWKPTVLYTTMALVLAVALWGYRKNFIQLILGSQLLLPDDVWRKLSAAWVFYCAFMAAANAYVVLYFSTEFWVSFKLWGFAFPVAFMVAQGFYIARHLQPEAPSEPEPEPKP